MAMNSSAQRPALAPALVDWLHDFNLLVEQMTASGYQPTAEGARDALAKLTSRFVPAGPAIAWVQDGLIAGPEGTVPVRIYDPQPDQALPVMVFFHGGGHAAGSVAAYDPIARRLAQASQHIVVSVDYRLAPECPYPAGLQDALAAAGGAFALLDSQQLPYCRSLVLAGDSAGGALAASVSAICQSGPAIRIDKQVLIYPSLDYTLSQPSCQENGRGYFLTTDRIEWYFAQYFQHGEDRQAVSALFAPVTGQLPQTLVISAGYDPLRDEASAYLERLAEAGVPAQHAYFPDMIHAFLNLEDLVPVACASAYARIGAFLLPG